MHTTNDTGVYRLVWEWHGDFISHPARCRFLDFSRYGGT